MKEWILVWLIAIPTDQPNQLDIYPNTETHSSYSSCVQELAKKNVELENTGNQFTIFCSQEADLNLIKELVEFIGRARP